MTDLMKVAPPRFGDGPVTGRDLERAVSVMYRDVFSRLDVRYANNDFAQGLVADNSTGGVTLGPQSRPTGRGVGVPSLVQKITDIGTAQDQRFLPQVSAGNKLSVQNTLPLSASANASTAVISVGAHTVQYGYGQVAFSSGSISGLSVNTTYYVYANDPAFGGGAVTYLATTNPQTVVAANGNYYVGSIKTPVSASTNTITGATSANPIVFTTGLAHAWNSGDQVIFASLPGDFGTHLNSTTQTITVTDATHFSIAVDGTTYSAYTSGGTATRVSSGTSGGGGGGGGYGTGGFLLP
jgi:hypothetical protein